MRSLKLAWLNIPRKIRISINLLLMVLVGFVIYLFLDCPPFTAEQLYRRAEKAHMVGPAEILEIFEPAGSSHQYLLVAEERDAVIFYLYHEPWYGYGELYYREKTGDLTVLAAPCVDLFEAEFEVDLPIFIFDNYPEATRAELEFTLSDTVNGEFFEKTYHLESDRENEGWFHFNIHLESEERYVDEWGFEHRTPLGSETALLYEFSYMCGYRDSFNLYPQPVTVRMYEESDTLILEETLLIRCVSDMAHIERNSVE